jgi:hypothetical protein
VLAEERAEFASEAAARLLVSHAVDTYGKLFLRKVLKQRAYGTHENGVGDGALRAERMELNDDLLWGRTARRDIAVPEEKRLGSGYGKAGIAHMLQEADDFARSGVERLKLNAIRIWSARRKFLRGKGANDEKP